MNVGQLVLQLLPYAVPSLVIILTYAWHYVYYLIPAAQRDLLNLVAGPILNQIELQWSNLPLDQKKAKALTLIKAAFTDLNMTPPDDSVINAFLDALLGASS